MTGRVAGTVNRSTSSKKKDKLQHLVAGLTGYCLFSSCQSQNCLYEFRKGLAECRKGKTGFDTLMCQKFCTCGKLVYQGGQVQSLFVPNLLAVKMQMVYFMVQQSNVPLPLTGQIGQTEGREVMVEHSLIFIPWIEQRKNILQGSHKVAWQENLGCPQNPKSELQASQ